jgi:pimeloyl-ACP methyl ester carboxylesterase
MTVLLVHGFPEMWLSWRHQMAALAARGFRALDPNLRGYGDSSVPADPAAYSILHIVGDLVALLDHLHLPRVFLVGHNWGTQVVWHLCLFRPDKVRTAVILGIPYFPRGPQLMMDSFSKLSDGYYINQFQVEFIFRCSTHSISLISSCRMRIWARRLVGHMDGSPQFQQGVVGGGGGRRRTTGSLDLNQNQGPEPEPGSLSWIACFLEPQGRPAYRLIGNSASAC